MSTRKGIKQPSDGHLVAGGDASAASTLETDRFSCQTLPCCVCWFSGGQMETILAWDSKSHGGKMPEGYLHLTCEQRCQIYALLQSGHSQAHISRKIGVDPSTISRELVRNTGARGYRFKQAHEKAS